MADPTIERLTERYRHLRDSNDRRFILELGSYLTTLDSSRRARRILKRLRREAESAATDFARRDRELVAELGSIRQRLEADAPEIRAAADPPEPEDPIRRRHWILETLSGFDLVAGTESQIGFAPLPYYSESNPGRTQELLQILRGRLHVAEWGAAYGRGQQPVEPLRNDLALYGVEIGNVQERYSAAKRDFKQKEQRLAGLADARLRLFVASLNPAPFLRDLNEDEGEFMERAFRRVLDDMGDRGILRRASEGQHLTQAEQASFDRAVAFLREELERLHVEVTDQLRAADASVRTRLTQWVKALPSWAVKGAAGALLGAAVIAFATYAWQRLADDAPGNPGEDAPTTVATTPTSTAGTTTNPG